MPLMQTSSPRHGRYLTIALTVFICMSRLMMALTSDSPVSLKLSAPDTPIKSGSLISMHVTLINRSGKSLTLVRSAGAERATNKYLVEIDYVNEGVSHTIEYNKMVRDHDPMLYNSTNILVDLQPGETFGEDIVVRASYDLGRPGLYGITISRDVILAGKTIHVQSNRVPISIR
jgi:hypothetical protein